MLKNQVKIAWLLILLVAIAGCQREEPLDELRGRITLWHSWSDAETEVLQDALDQFQEIHRILSFNGCFYYS